MAAVFQYPGGKARIAAWIADLLPPPGAFRVFADVFGGSGAVLLEVMRRCDRAGVRDALFVFNDLDGEVVNFFRVLREPGLRARLLEALEWTPYARAEYEACLAAPPADDPVERARRFFVLRQQSYGGLGQHKGQWMRYSEGGRQGGPGRWASARRRLEAFGRAFQRVQIENLDFADLIRGYDRPGALFYCDPPYHPGARRGGDLYGLELPRSGTGS